MKRNWFQHAGTFALFLLLAAAPLHAADLTRLDALPGSKVRIEGTSTIHDWQVQGSLIGGHLEVGPGFPTQPGQKVEPGKVEATAEVFIPVRSLKSVEKDGSPYSDKMNNVMYEKMKQPQHQRIVYRLKELVLKEAPKSADAPYAFDSKGELVVAGATNQISMPVRITPLAGNKLKITGDVGMKMSDFGIEPPVLIGLLKTGDEIKLHLEWMVGQRPAAPVTTPK